MNKKAIGFFLLFVVSAFPFWNNEENVEQQETESKRLVKFSVHIEERIKAVKSKWVGSIKYQGETKIEAQLQLTKNEERINKFLLSLGFEAPEIKLTTNIIKNKKVKSLPNPYGGAASSDDPEEEKFTGVLSIKIKSKKVDLIQKLGPILKKKYEDLSIHWNVYPSFDNDLDLEFKLLEKAFAQVESISKKIELLMNTKVKKIYQAKWTQVKIRNSQDPYAYPGGGRSSKDSHISVASLVLNIQLELDS